MVMTEADIVAAISKTLNVQPAAAGSRRHLYLYLQAAGLLKAMHGSRVLHFAPEAHLQRLIAAESPQEYVRADLMPVRAHVHRPI
jgi:hypothetical protein